MGFFKMVFCQETKTKNIFGYSSQKKRTKKRTPKRQKKKNKKTNKKYFYI